VAPLLPLFPLDLVLFPSTPLPLHIFEPRYKEMIGECLAQKKQFGVVRAQGEAVAEMGCTAEILEVVKRYPDGKLDIQTVGRQRFEVVEMNSERSFLQAEVLLIDDEPGTPPKESIDRALELHAQILDTIGGENTIPADAPQLSYHLAGALPMDLDFKQTLLGVRSEVERIEGLIEFYEAILPKLRKAARRRQKAGGNGHVP
jgi:Lon protease-like protein